MAQIMRPEPEYTRHERFLQYAETLRERFEQGVLAELQDVPQWVVWRAEFEDGRPKKVPYNPNYAHMTPMQPRASVKIPTNWGTLPEALTAMQSGHYSGLGFVLTPPLVMIDLDHSVDKTTGLLTDPQAQEIVEALNSYTERSQVVQDCIFFPMDSYQEKASTPQLKCMDRIDLLPSRPTI